MKINLKNFFLLKKRELLQTVMKTFIILCFTTVYSFTPFNGFSQKAIITMDRDRTVSVPEMFNIIQQQTAYKFVYSDETIAGAPKIKLSKGKVSLKDLLEASLASLNCSVEVTEDETIILVRQHTKAPILLREDDQLRVAGIVTDTSGEPLPGASILIKGTKDGTTTDINGKFTISVDAGSVVLVISYIGFVTRELEVNEGGDVKIALREAASTLDEVVVHGFRKSLEESISIKKNSTNSVDAVVAEDIAKFPQSNMAEALQRVSGVQIRRDNAGGVGNEVSIRGLPPEYTQVTINGDAVPNSTEGRNYDFNTLPAEIFKQVEVIKTPTASTTEGGIGGSVNLVTKKPFELKKRVIVASAESIYNTQQQEGNSITPKLSLTYGNKWNDRFGIIAGVFYNKFYNTSEGYDVTRYYDESYDLDGDGGNEFQDIQVPRPRYVSEGQQVERLSVNLSMQYQVNKNFDLVFEGMFVNNDQTVSRYTPIWFLPGTNPSNIKTDGPLVQSITYETVTAKLENQQQSNVTKNYQWSMKGKYNLGRGWKASYKFIHAFNKRDSERFRYYADNVNTVTYSVENDLQFFDLQTPTNFSNADEFYMTQARRYLWEIGRASCRER